MSSNSDIDASGYSDEFKAILLGAGLLVVAALFLPFGLDRQANRDAENARIAAEAVSVTGRIVSSSLKHRCPLSEYSDCFWRIDVKFGYEVDGSQYTKEQEWKVRDELIPNPFDDQEGSKATGERRAAQYVKDKTVRINYHPSDPSDAWLGQKPSAGFSLLMLPVFAFGIWGAIILAFGIYFQVSDPK